MAESSFQPGARRGEPAGDPQFTLGLLLEVAKVLEAHGYELLNGGQYVELQQHLFCFLHGDPTRDCTGGAR